MKSLRSLTLLLSLLVGGLLLLSAQGYELEESPQGLLLKAYHSKIAS